MNRPRSYCHVLCEHVSMADMVSGGLKEDRLLLFVKEELGRQLLGHRGISRRAILDSEHLKTLLPRLSLSEDYEKSAVTRVLEPLIGILS